MLSKTDQATEKNIKTASKTKEKSTSLDAIKEITVANKTMRCAK